MAPEDTGPITVMLRDAAGGDAESAAKLLPLLYAELRALADARLARAPAGNTLQPTALVHEAYMRLVGGGDPGWQGRGHFFGAAARAMRDILVEQARRKGRVKRGGDRRREMVDPDAFAMVDPVEDVVALDEALARLEAEDPRKGQIVNLRFFAGLTAPQTAEAMNLSLGTIEREWRYIRAWLFDQLAGPGQVGP